jgi:glycosyltransferase involved in cell wall biosynthesis
MIRRKLKIAQVANIIERVPPKKYGGIERMVYWLTEELVNRGHEVTLFASGDSLTSAKLNSIYPQALREANLKNIYGGNNLTMVHFANAFNDQNKFDIIHNHAGPISIPIANMSKTPVVMTIHGNFNIHNQDLYERGTNISYVSISKAQARPRPASINYAGNVYNGLYMEDYPYSSTPGNYLLFVGRICLEKGVHNAIKVAKYLDMPFIIAAKLDTNVPDDVAYFKQYIEPELSDKIRWVGEVDEIERNQLMKGALCLLHPITWPEPFGLTLIETMATGTPVIAFNKGSIPEVINHGITGFVVSDVEEMIKAVPYVKYLNRATCREYALGNFSAEKMAEGYEEIYYKILSQKSTQDLAKAFVESKMSQFVSHPDRTSAIESFALDIKPSKRKD